MKLSYQWLNEYVKIDDIEPSKVAMKLTMCTSEIEGIEETGSDLDKVVVGRIVEVKPHPDSSHLFVTKIDVGNELLGIVSGAPNTRKDTFVPVALIGARLPGGLVVKKAKLRGVESFGVVCSEKELGVSDDHTGLWILDEENVQSGQLKPGVPVGRLFPTKDYIIDIDNKSLTNRPDLWGHYGFVRELAALFRREAKPVYPQEDINTVIEAREGDPIDLEIRDETLCPRYTAIRLSGIEVKKSPFLLRRRLFTLGVRPINTIVDITNYVMLHTGQPLHAFDASKISGNKIIVRRARQNEEFYTLDGVLRTLTPDTLLIADSEKGIAAAGVMGGSDSEIDEHTDTIIIESANFHPVNIRRTALRLGLRTEASNRFEKSLDPELTIFGLAGSVSMIKSLLPQSKISSPLADAYFSRKGKTTIALDTDWVSKMIGAPIEKKRIVEIVRSLNFGVEETGGPEVKVAVPSYRAYKDVTIPQDLVEEIGRVYGYDNIEPVLPHIESTPPFRDEILSFIRELKGILSGDLSFTEVYTYSFQDDKILELFYDEDTPFVRLKNPVSIGLSRLRRNLIPGLYGLIEKNAVARSEFSVFEIGSVYSPHQSCNKDSGELPDERKRLCALMLGKEAGRPVFFQLKGRLECLFEKLNLGDAALVSIDTITSYSKRINLQDQGNLKNYHPGRRALLCYEATAFGIISELNPKLLKQIGIDFHACRAAFFEIDIPLLKDLAKDHEKRKRYNPLPRFPEVVLAFAVVVDETVPVDAVREFIRSYDSELIERVTLFDIYRDKPLPEGKKNLAFNVYYRLQDRTLTEKEANRVHEEIARKIREHGWELR